MLCVIPNAVRYAGVSDVSCSGTNAAGMIITELPVKTHHHFAVSGTRIQKPCAKFTLVIVL